MRRKLFLVSVIAAISALAFLLVSCSPQATPAGPTATATPKPICTFKVGDINVTITDSTLQTDHTQFQFKLDNPVKKTIVMGQLDMNPPMSLTIIDENGAVIVEDVLDSVTINGISLGTISYSENHTMYSLPQSSCSASGG